MNSKIISSIITVLVPTQLQATEPNQTFETATVLSAGVLSVSDTLTPQIFRFPDTLLGARNSLGSIYRVDDDSSPVGSGTASALEDVETNSGTIRFAVTGVGDTSFAGAHSEVGGFEVFVTVYNSIHAEVESFREVRTLESERVHEFSFFDSTWTDGSYDVYIDNTIDIAPADVDFFTFTGLAPGTQFSGRTLDPSGTGIDTYLGWFDSTGLLLDTDENGGGGFLSRIQGVVPANGMLTFAVTGFGDNNFAGIHSEEGSYELRLDLDGVALAGDYNGNQVVDAADYVVWRNTLNDVGSGLPADGNNNGRIDSGDYDIWRWRFGNGPLSGGARLYLVPEPSSYALVAICALFTFQLCPVAGRGYVRQSFTSWNRGEDGFDLSLPALRRE